jgi:predicted outer membrane protein
MRFGIVAAVCTCFVVGYAVAQQQQINPGETKPSQIRKDAADRNATGQIDRSTTQQGERSATQYKTGFRGTQATGNNAQRVERYLAECLLAKNQGEIELAEIAQQKSENPEVKQFAEMLVQDHGQLVQKLQPIAGKQTAARAEGRGEPGRDRNATDAPRLDERVATDQDRSANPADTAGAGGGPLMQLAAIEKKIHERCLQALKEELQQKSGAEFDECFVGAQIGGHMQAVAALEVLGQETQGQLQQLAQEAQPKVQQHLDHAKQLAKQLKASTPQVGQADRPARTQR